jgi:hypothetical protein
MNPTFLDAPRALAAAAVAFALMLVLVLIAPAVTAELDGRFGDRSVAEAGPVPQAVGPATWAQDPLASPLETLRR